MKTYLNNEILPTTLGILYLCTYTTDPPHLQVDREIQFKDSFEALNAYAEIPNPESQLATGNTQETLFRQLEKLHSNITNPEWLKDLANYL